MVLILSLFIMAIIYVKSFSNDFESEKIDKAVPFLSIVGLAVLGFAIFSNW